MTRQLSSEFKREYAELVLNYGYAHKDAAKTMNVSISSIQRWVTQYRKERQGITPKNSTLTPEQKRIQALEKQVKQLQSDNQLLKIVEWAFSDKPNSNLTVKALNMAIHRRKGESPTLFHCDQGIQYRSEQFQQILASYQITFSMSRAGNCIDNAVTERFFRSLKSERIIYRDYVTREQAIADIIDYIEPIYNQKRRHYKLGFISPAEFEHNLLKTA